MFAFLFDSQHPEADKFAYGPPCTSRVVQAIERLEPIPSTQILWGDILFGFLVYDIARVKTGPSDLPSASHVTEISYQGNSDLNLTLACDLAETLSESPSTAQCDELLPHIAKGTIWSLVTPSLDLISAQQVDSDLRAYSPYLGMAVIDPCNPTYRHIMFENMTQGCFVDAKGIHYQIEPGLDPGDLADRQGVADTFGSRHASLIEESHKYQSHVPRFVLPGENSMRGVLSAQRVAGKLSDSHRQKVARALLDHFERLPRGTSREFVAKDEVGPEFIVEESKARNYLLNINHAHGGPKAKFFIDHLGIEPEDWLYLADQLVSGVKKASLYRVADGQHGVSHGAVVAVEGRNGKVVAVETGWQVPALGPTRLVTAYPADVSLIKDLEISHTKLVAKELSGVARWSAIFELADQAGQAAAAVKVATPMVLEKYGTIWDGMCGHAWVQFPNAREPFAKWLRDEQGGYASSPGVTFFSRTSSQSIDINVAYAKAFAGVVGANGITCSVNSRLD